MAYFAGVCARNVSKVKTILEKAGGGTLALPHGTFARQSINALRMEKIGAGAGVLLRALLQREAREPGSVELRAGTGKKTLILRRL
jgi:hypothetical protein